MEEDKHYLVDDNLNWVEGMTKEELDDVFDDIANRIENLESRSIITLIKTANQTNVVAGRTYEATFQEEVKKGTALSKNGNAVEIGSGVSKVKVSCNMRLALSVGNSNVEIVNSRTGIVAHSYVSKPEVGTPTAGMIASKLIEVEEGDRITVATWFGSSSNSSGYIGDQQGGSYLTVEVVE